MNDGKLLLFGGHIRVCDVFLFVSMIMILALMFTNNILIRLAEGIFLFLHVRGFVKYVIAFGMVDVKLEKAKSKYYGDEKK